MSSAGQSLGDHGSSPPTSEEVLAQLNRILADPRFVRSRRHSNFLKYIVEKTLAGTGDELKEYTIASEVYGKSASYDPSVDSIVRVEAARLRSKMIEYYATNGRDDPVRIDFPKGTYAPVFIAQAPLAAPSEALAPHTDKPEPAPMLPRSPVRLSRISTIAGTVLLASAITFLIWRVIHNSTPPVTDTISSVAVLSFISFTADADMDAFAAGLTEGVSNALSRSGAVRLAVRTSVLPFETKPDSLMSIGQQLQTGAVLEGSVRREGDGMRIAAQLGIL